MINGERSLSGKLSVLSVLVIAFCFLLPGSAPAQDEIYQILPSGWVYAVASAINNDGTVVGYGQDADTDKGFIYSGDTYVELLPSDWFFARALGVNDNGVVVGSGSDGITDQGFIYRDGSYRELLPEDWISAWALGINNNGDVVGYGYDGTVLKGFIYGGEVYGSSSGEPDQTISLFNSYVMGEEEVRVKEVLTDEERQRLIDTYGPYVISETKDAAGTVTETWVLWNEAADFFYLNEYGRAYILDRETGLVSFGDGENGMVPPAGQDNIRASYRSELLPRDWVNAYAYDVNDNSDVVGYGYDGTRYKGFIYDVDYTELLPPGWVDSYALAINNNGVVAGYGNDGTGYRGFIYDGETYTELLPPGWVDSFALAINENGAVVGYGNDGTGYKGFVYEAGAYSELLYAGRDNSYAIAVNDNGIVAGYGNNVSDRAFIPALFTPYERMAAAINFFDTCVSNGSLTGLGSTMSSSDGKLHALGDMLDTAEMLVRNGSIADACLQLADAYRKTDGNPNPPDFVAGSSTAQLASQIQTLMNSLGCP